MADQLGAGDWERAALAAILEGGVDAVAIEPLARRLGVTKGSFYWHFSSRDALLGAAIERWVADQLAPDPDSSEPDPRAALEHLLRKALRLLGKPTIQRRLTSHADRDPRIAAALAEVARVRTERIAALYRRLGLEPAAARARAIVVYATILGLEQLDREGGLGVGQRALVRQLRLTLEP